MFTTSCNSVWRSKVNVPITESLKEKILLVNNKYNRNNFFNYLLLMSTCKKKKKVCSLIYLTKEIREKATMWTLFSCQVLFLKAKVITLFTTNHWSFGDIARISILWLRWRYSIVPRKGYTVNPFFMSNKISQGKSNDIVCNHIDWPM